MLAFWVVFFSIDKLEVITQLVNLDWWMFYDFYIFVIICDCN